jgi:hypothetical protein
MANNLADSVKDGVAYRLTALSADVDAGDTLLLVKNVNTRDFKVDHIVINGGNVASLYDIHYQATADTTPAGTAVLAAPLNPNGDSGEGGDLTAKADETGYSTQGTILEEASVGANSRVVVDMNGLTLGYNQAVAVDQVTESTSGGCTLVGYFV